MIIGMGNQESGDKMHAIQTYDTDTILQKMEDDFAEMQKFNDTMDCFYQGELSLYEDLTYKKDIEKNIRDELIGVLDNAEEYPDDYNLTARTYTQKTDEKIGEILQNFGYELYQKYTIEGSKDEHAEGSVCLDDQYINIYPEFTFTDIKKLLGFLQKIEIADEKTTKNISLIIHSLGKKIKNGFTRYWTDEELDIYNHASGIYKEIKRLGLEKDEEIYRWSDYFIALQEGYLDKFKECVNAGFYAKISNEDIMQPMFFEIINTDEEVYDPDDYYEMITKIDQDIQNSRHIFDKIRDIEPLLKKITEELYEGIKNISNRIKTNKTLTIAEKEQWIEHFNKYLCEIESIYTQNHTAQEKSNIKASEEHPFKRTNISSR